MKKVRMYFPRNYNVNDFIYSGGEEHDIEDTPGSIDRWLRRGCVIVEKKAEEVEEIKEEIVEVIEEPVESVEEIIEDTVEEKEEIIEEIKKPRKSKNKKK